MSQDIMMLSDIILSPQMIVIAVGIVSLVAGIYIGVHLGIQHTIKRDIYTIMVADSVVDKFMDTNIELTDELNRWKKLCEILKKDSDRMRIENRVPSIVLPDSDSEAIIKELKLKNKKLRSQIKKLKVS